MVEATVTVNNLTTNSDAEISRPDLKNYLEDPNPWNINKIDLNSQNIGGE